MSQSCHICGLSLDVESLETAERAGWSRSKAGWICESYDCYMSCDHPPISLTAPAEAGSIKPRTWQTPEEYEAEKSETAALRRKHQGAAFFFLVQTYGGDDCVLN